MLTSLAYIFLLGLFLSYIFEKIKLPRLLGQLMTGIILGPYFLDLLDGSILNISADLRQFALVIILIRVGFSLDTEDLKKVGRPAALMCFVPACFEIVATVILAPLIIGVTKLEAAIIGAVIAAVSPAVIVPRMLKLMEEGYGTDKSIPQLIMTGASVDDIFVIVLFTSFLSMAMGNDVSAFAIAKIPMSIIFGVVVGIVIGSGLNMFFRAYHMRDSAKVIILLSIAFLLIAMGDIFSFSGLLAIMSMGATVYKFNTLLAKRLSLKFSKLWVAAEIVLFVLVGATLDIKYALAEGFGAVILVMGVLLFRMIGVLVSLIGTELSWKERIFCMIAYMPKATVQAAIGGIPLSLGLPIGQTVLTIAVLSIIITAPIGAIGIDMTYKYLLKNQRV